MASVSNPLPAFLAGAVGPCRWALSAKEAPSKGAKSALQFGRHESPSDKGADAVRRHDQQQHGEHHRHRRGVVQVFDQDDKFQTDAAGPNETQDGRLPDAGFKIEKHVVGEQRHEFGENAPGDQFDPVGAGRRDGFQNSRIDIFYGLGKKFSQSPGIVDGQGQDAGKRTESDRRHHQECPDDFRDAPATIYDEPDRLANQWISDDVPGGEKGQWKGEDNPERGAEQGDGDSFKQFNPDPMAWCGGLAIRWRHEANQMNVPTYVMGAAMGTIFASGRSFVAAQQWPVPDPTCGNCNSESTDKQFT